MNSQSESMAVLDFDPEEGLKGSPRRARKWPRFKTRYHNQVPRNALRAVEKDRRQIGRKKLETSIPLATIVAARDLTKSGWLLRGQVEEALQMIGLHKLAEISSRVNFTVEFDREIGLSRIIETSLQDEEGENCFWAPTRDSRGRFHRTCNGARQFRRYVIGHRAQATNLLTLALVREESRIEVVTAYYGAASALHPSDPLATTEDRRWWFDRKTKCGHAFVLDHTVENRVDLSQKRLRCPH